VPLVSSWNLQVAVAHGIQDEGDWDNTSVNLEDSLVLVDRKARPHSRVLQDQQVAVDEMHFDEPCATLGLALPRLEQIA